MNNKLTTGKTLVPKTVIGALADAFDRSFQTIEDWIAKRDDRLTSDKAKKVYAEFNFDWQAKLELDVAQVA